QLLLDAREAAPRAREELVPGAEARQLVVDLELERRRPRPLEARLRLGREAFLDGQALAAQQQRALGQLGREIGLPGVDLAPQLPLERGDRVDPRLDPVAPGPAGVRREGRGEAVVAELLQGHVAPARR